LFYLLEPFGFPDEEYRTAAALTLLYNINAGKGKNKDVKDFMRDMPKAVLAEFTQPKGIEAFDETQRRRLIEQIKKDFGIK